MKLVNVDSLKLDSLHRKIQIPKLGGQFGFQSYFSNSQFSGQEMPNSYIRTNANIQANVSGIIVRIDGLVSNEGRNSGNNLNKLTVSIDPESIQNAIQTKILNKNKRLKDSIEKEIQKKRKEIEQLNLLLSDQGAVDRLNKVKAQNEKFLTDTFHSYLDSVQYQNNLYEINHFSKKQNESKDLIAQLKKYEQIIKHTALSKPSDFGNINYNQKGFKDIGKLALDSSRKLAVLRDTLVQMNRISPMQNFLMNIKDFQLMDFYSYKSTIALNGLAIRGAQIESNPGKLIIGITAGMQTPPQFRMIPARKLNGKGLFCGQLGFGKLDKSYISGFYLMGEAENNPQKPSLEANYVYGVQGKLKEGSVELKYELLLSRNRYLVTYNPNIYQELKLTNSINQAKAILVNYQQYFSITKTKFGVKYSRIDPLFFSIGNPFLRVDLQKGSVQIDQSLPFLKLGLYSNISLSNDNLNQQKSVTSFFKDYELGLKHKYKRLNTNLSYRRFSCSQNKKQLLYSYNYYKLIGKLNYKVYKKIWTSSLGFFYTENRGQNNDSLLAGRINVSLTQLCVLGANATFSANFLYINSYQDRRKDTIQQYDLSMNFRYNLGPISTTLSSSFLIQNEIRRSFGAAVVYESKNGIQCSLAYSYYLNGIMSDGNIGNLSSMNLNIVYLLK